MIMRLGDQKLQQQLEIISSYCISLLLIMVNAEQCPLLFCLIIAQIIIQIRMQQSQLGQLANIKSHSQLSHFLQQLLHSPLHKYSTSSLQSIENCLISFSCHKNNHHEQQIHLTSLTLITKVLTIITKTSKESTNRLINAFFRHLMADCSCFTSYWVLMMMIDSNTEILMDISFEKLKKLNNKVIGEFESQSSGLNWLKGILEKNKKPTVQACQYQLQKYLKTKFQPIMKSHDERENVVVMGKIPPLVLPTSKSINSSRYSIKSKQQRRKGLGDLRKLAGGLGQSFIAIELGSLLAQKRTLQVQQFTHNSDFRNRCFDKIQTDRLNSSRLGTINQQPDNNEYQCKKLLRKVLLMNGNLILKKLQNYKNGQAFYEGSTYLALIQSLIQQYCELIIVGIIKISQITPLKFSKSTNNADFQYNYLESHLASFQQIISQIFTISSKQCQIFHLGLLMNRNKENSNNHYSINSQSLIFKDQLLGTAQIIRQNSLAQVKGPYQINTENIHKADMVIQYITKVLRQLFSNSSSNTTNTEPLLSMNHSNPYTQFYHYQNNILSIIGFYLSNTKSKCIPYQAIDCLMPIMIMIKRQILQLSHPYLHNNYEVQQSKLNSLDGFSKSPKVLKKHKSHKEQVPLIYTQQWLFANYLSVVGQMVTNNKHVQKLFSNLFMKNIHFMELVENYAQQLFKRSLYMPIMMLMKFYKRILQAYHQRKIRNQDSKTLRVIFQHLGSLFCPKNGCIAKLLIESEELISPWSLETEQVQNNKWNRQTQPTHQSNKLYLLHQVLKFISDVYSYCEDELSSSLLEEQVASFYIKYSIMGFIKLYSFLTVNELANIHESTSKSQDPLNLKMNSSQIYMVDFLKILTNISIHRTVQISKKFRQYRVLQFFVRELQLEFTVAHNIEKYVKKNKIVFDEPKIINKGNKKGGKKITVPGLNLTSELFRGASRQKNEPNSNDIQELKMNLTLKDSTYNSKKIVPTLKLPTKTTQNEEIKGKFQTQQTKTHPPELMLELNKIHKTQKPTPTHSSERQLVYSSQRRIRKIYSNKVLHSESILLILSLLLYKGLLDGNYCDRFPITQGKINVLYILHYHLNHQSNRGILPLLGSAVEQIKPYLSGQRLLKLLSNSMTDISNYQDWQKISKGAYGTVYSCNTNLNSPKQVAIKQMSFPRTIYERCVLHDIFTEISCLENFRLDPRITTMYNYGVVDNTYVIVLKKYDCSLRDWCLKMIGKGEINLSQILTLYWQVLKIIQVLHDHNVTHYDIKGDNIMLETLENGQLRVVFGDFGECKIFQNQKEQLDMKSRGTQCIQSPQMLTLSLNNKKESDNYDRRKRIGTTKASDIWSLGCLLYQMITGQYLYHRTDWFKFYGQVTSVNSQLLTNQNYDKLKHNAYIIDFLKYILIRDPQHRPSIANIVNRFQNIYAILVPNPQSQVSTTLPKSPLIFKENLDDMINLYTQDIQQNTDNHQTSHRSAYWINLHSKLLKIMEDIYFCDNQFLIANPHKLHEEGITHIITTLPHPPSFFVSLILKSEKSLQPSRLCPKISDLLREVLLMKGKVLFVNDSTNYATNLLIFTLSYWFRCSVYETWCLINTQILLFPTFTSDLRQLSSTLNLLNKIQNHIEQLPKLQCICGSVTMILRRKIPDKKGEFRICKCKKKQNGDTYEQQQDCPSLSCAAYIEFLKKRYNIGWDHIKWSYIPNSLFLTDPQSETKTSKIVNQILLNSSLPVQNMRECGSLKKGWKMYGCKVCEMWIMRSNANKQNWVIMNNQIKSIRQGIMIPNAQQNFKMRTPALNYYTLSKLHMIEQ